MIYQVKLKSGFFKTMRYKLTVEDDQLILMPELKEDIDVIVVKNEDLIELGIIKFPGGKVEFEIITIESYYFGCIAQESDIEGLVQTLKKSFGRRFIVE